VKKLFYLILICFSFLIGCRSQPPVVPGVETLSQSEYMNRIDPYTKKIEKYQGIVNVLQFSATLINSKVAQAQLMQKARLYQWDSATFNSEMQKMNSQLDKATEVFISFYTPERKHDDLHKNQTLWKIFLDADGRRWEGKATKIKLLTNEVQGIYPDHNRFATPYMLTFPISIRNIESNVIRLTLTGTVTSATVEFQP
jgi:hypothetical protein